METWLLENGAEFVGTAFYGSIIVIALWEFMAPRRALTRPFGVRWLNNIAITAMNMALARWLLPMAAVAVAMIAQERQIGLMHIVALPWLPALILAVLLKDMFEYFVHRFEHGIPALWSLHLVHHSDPDMDFTTNTRHHFVELVVTKILVAGFIVAMGLPPAAVLVHEILRAFADTFNHGNINLKGRADRVLRWFVVTPDMHRVHHSARQPETDSNFGSLIPWWDRLFGTYCSRPEGGHEGMAIGLTYFRDNRNLYLDRLLWQPVAWWMRERLAARQTPPRDAAGIE